METMYDICTWMWWAGWVHLGVLILWRPKFPDTYTGGMDSLLVYCSFGLWWALAFWLFWIVRLYELFKYGR